MKTEGVDGGVWDSLACRAHMTAMDLRFMKTVRREGRVDMVKCLTPHCCCDWTRDKGQKEERWKTHLLFSFT